MLQSTMTRAYTLGLGYGNLWMVIVCIAFGIQDVLEITTTLAGSVLSILATLLIGGVLLLLCRRFLRLGYALPKIAAKADAEAFRPSVAESLARSFCLRSWAG